MPPLRITISLLVLLCFAAPAQAIQVAPPVQQAVQPLAQMTPNEGEPIRGNFYQQQLDKLNYSLRKDGSFEVSGQAVRFPWTGPQMVKPLEGPLEGPLEEDASDRTSSSDMPSQINSTSSQIKPSQIKPSQTRNIKLLPLEVPKTQSSPSQFFKRSTQQPTPQQPPTPSGAENSEAMTVAIPEKTLDQTATETKTLGQRLNFLHSSPLNLAHLHSSQGNSSQGERKDPYTIVAEAREKHSVLQTADFPKPALLREKLSDRASQLNLARVKKSFDTFKENSPLIAPIAVNENIERLKAQLEKRFLIEGLSLSELPASWVVRIKDHADRTKVSLKEKTRSLLEHVESKAGKAAEALR